MDVDSILERIYADGKRNDAVAPKRDSMMLNITPATGVLLDLLVSESKPTRILELGTSNGYSTAWLGRAASRVGASVDSIEISPHKAELASKNLIDCNVADSVTVHTAEGGDFLRKCKPSSYDLIYLDSDRQSYLHWASDLIRVIRFGLLAVDNATSHYAELANFKRHLQDEFGLSTVILPVGNGQMIVQPSC